MILFLIALCGACQHPFDNCSSIRICEREVRSFLSTEASLQHDNTFFERPQWRSTFIITNFYFPHTVTLSNRQPAVTRWCDVCSQTKYLTKILSDYIQRIKDFFLLLLSLQETFLTKYNFKMDSVQGLVFC